MGIQKRPHCVVAPNTVNVVCLAKLNFASRIKIWEFSNDSGLCFIALKHVRALSDLGVVGYVYIYIYVSNGIVCEQGKNRDAPLLSEMLQNEMHACKAR